MVDKPRSSSAGSGAASPGAKNRSAPAAKPKRQTASSLPLPRPAPDTGLEELFLVHRIPSEYWPMAKAFLDELVAVFAGEIRRERREPALRADRQTLHKAQCAVEQALAVMKRPLGPAARRSLRAAGPRLGPVVSAGWLRERFPDDEYVPTRHALPIDHQASRVRYPGLARLRRNDNRLDVEQFSGEARAQFVEMRPAETMRALLESIQAALQAAQGRFLLLPGARGGQKPLLQRRYMLANLAELWHRIGRSPSSGPASDFLAFCEGLCTLIGWPDEGLETAVADALVTWRDRRQKHGG